MKEVVNTKTPSGSLILETKGVVGDSSSPMKLKKRSRVVVSDSESSDDDSLTRKRYKCHQDLKKDDSNELMLNESKKENKQKQMKMVKRDVNMRKRVSSGASFTEKQLLREKIKKMLLGAGWTIDYRPRRGRDYLDSVYISPSGSAYWSITKAYDTLRKDEKDRSKAGGEFTPLPNEILCKLTRQTRKKIEKEIQKLSSSKKVTKKVKKSVVVEKSQQSGLKKSSNSIVRGGEKRRLSLVVRGGLEDVNNGGKRNLLSWLIDSGMVSVGEKVEYMNLRKTRVMEQGWVTEDGIHCDCCSKSVTISRFELHAGSKLGRPFENMFMESGKSLMQCQIDGWKKEQVSGFDAVDIDGDDPNDDTCGICGDGGDLICCDGCPSTFHLSCLDMQMLPQGDWHCPNCACKYCKRIGGYGSGRTENSLLTCHLCDKKYHKSCSPGTDGMGDLDFPFCQHKCRQVYKRLQKLMWVKHELDSGFSWSLIRRSDPLPDVSSVNFSQRVESNSKLAIALSVMDECFLPIIDNRSGISVIHNILYNCGSNFSRLNYSGFTTAILEKGDEMICAASIRIHGTQLAEMPFIGTRNMYRRQGMCRRLLTAIESALSSLKVEKLVIPAIEEHLPTWTNAFGFSPLEVSQKQEMRSINMLVFPRTDMLHKRLSSHKGKKGIDVNNKSLEPELNYAAKQHGEKKSDEQSDPTVLNGVVLDGNEIIGGADLDSKLEEIDNGITHASLLQRQVPDADSIQVRANDSILVDANNTNV